MEDFAVSAEVLISTLSLAADRAANTRYTQSSLRNNVVADSQRLKRMGVTQETRTNEFVRATRRVLFTSTASNYVTAIVLICARRKREWRNAHGDVYRKALRCAKSLIIFGACCTRGDKFFASKEHTRRQGETPARLMLNHSYSRAPDVAINEVTMTQSRIAHESIRHSAGAKRIYLPFCLSRSCFTNTGTKR